MYAFRVNSKALLTKLGYTGNLDEVRKKGVPFKSPQLTFKCKVDAKMLEALKAMDAVSEIVLLKEAPLGKVDGMNAKAAQKIKTALDQPEAQRFGKRPATSTQQ